MLENFGKHQVCKLLFFVENYLLLSIDHHWTIENNRKKYLDEFAIRSGFHPTDADAWLNIRRIDVAKEKVQQIILNFNPHGPL